MCCFFCTFLRKAVKQVGQKSQKVGHKIEKNKLSKKSWNQKVEPDCQKNEKVVNEIKQLVNQSRKVGQKVEQVFRKSKSW